MSNKGWICIHRKIQDCILWIDDEPFDRRSAWIDLLLLANHKDVDILFNGQKITIKRGQYLTSVRKLANKWHWGKDRVLRFLRLLEELEMIHREADARRTLITIEKYDVFQDIQDTDKDSNKDTDKDTDKPQTTMRTMRTSKRKNIKKKNTFNEFKQNVYDFDELEKKLIKN